LRPAEIEREEEEDSAGYIGGGTWSLFWERLRLSTHVIAAGIQLVCRKEIRRELALEHLV
jgi:hypothetical protein